MVGLRDPKLRAFLGASSTFISETHDQDADDWDADTPEWNLYAVRTRLNSSPYKDWRKENSERLGPAYEFTETDVSNPKTNITRINLTRLN